MGFSFESSGSYDKTEQWLAKMAKGDIFASLDAHGRAGVAALAAATPRRTGRTAQSWQYRIIKTPGSCTVEWYNTNVQKGAVIAILIHYGHGTGTGGYVQGVNYIGTAIHPIFDAMVRDILKEVNA
jgi:hypothetical protein